MENFQKINEITPEEAKNLDSNRIEYIALSSGELYYIKKPNQQNNIQEENNVQKEEELKEIKTNEKEEEEKDENINNNIHQEIEEEKKEILEQNQELIE